MAGDVLLPAPKGLESITGFPSTDDQDIRIGTYNTIYDPVVKGLRARPGLVFTNWDATSTTSYIPVFGAHFWAANSTFYSVLYVSGAYKLYRNENSSYTDDSTYIQDVTGGTFEQKMEFIEFFDGTTHKLILLTGTNGYIIATNHAVTAISDGDFPTPHIPKAAVLDGYLFVGKRGTNQIYNCNVIDPTTWQASTYIATEQKGGEILGLFTHKTSIAAITTLGVEFFRDAAIPTPNSPLLREPQKFIHLRGLSPQSMMSFEDKIWFVGKDVGASSFWALCEIDNYAPKIHQNDAMRKFTYGGAVWGATSSGGTAGWSTPIYPIKLPDRTIIVIDSSNIGTTITTTANSNFPAIVFDATNEVWSFWSHVKASSASNFATTPQYFGNGMDCIGSYQNFTSTSTSSQGESIMIPRLTLNPGTTPRMPTAQIQGLTTQTAGFDYTSSYKVAIRCGAYMLVGADAPGSKVLARMRPMFTTAGIAADANNNNTYSVYITEDADNYGTSTPTVSLTNYSLEKTSVASNLGRWRTCRLAITWINGISAPAFISSQLRVIGHSD